MTRTPTPPPHPSWSPCEATSCTPALVWVPHTHTYTHMHTRAHTSSLYSTPSPPLAHSLTHSLIRSCTRSPTRLHTAKALEHIRTRRSTFLCFSLAGVDSDDKPPCPSCHSLALHSSIQAEIPLRDVAASARRSVCAAVRASHPVGWPNLQQNRTQPSGSPAMSQQPTPPNSISSL